MDNKKVIVLTTGGTIAMKLDPAHGIVPAVSGEDLVASVPGLREACPIEVMEFSNIPSPHMTPKRMFELGNKVEELLRHEDILGVVITHGTDTLEETAYLLDLVHKREAGLSDRAMRSAAEISPDGPVNLCAPCARRRVRSPGKGVLVVMNEEIHAAREVVKSHSANTETFVSPFWGPLGYVDPDRVVFRRNTLGRQSIRPPELVEDVHLIKLASGSDSLLIDFLVERNVRGLVLEAFGRGNVPPAALPGIRRAVEKGIPVVITTRTIAGRVLDVYGYEGGAKTVLEAGGILGGETSGPKARLKLMLALGVASGRDELAVFFDTP
ncbi:MAG: asparaginase [Bilophila wadsworthia]